MPTYEWYARFMREYLALGALDAAAFRRASVRFVAALKANRAPKPGLGIREMTDYPGIFEFRYSARGRATFHYGTAARGPHAHIVWRRIGGHEIYREP